MKVRNAGHEEKIELQMTPMIDIVFQLLVFFIMTFKIVSQEGDFEIKMPLASASESADQNDDVLPLRLEMTASANGELASMRIADANRSFQDFDSLHTYVRGYFADAQDKAEVELNCDYNLRYEFVVEALTAVRGYRRDDGSIEDLVTKIKFAPPDEDPEG